MRWLALACGFLGACHLAETPERAPEPVDTTVWITIASCVLTPDSVKVAVNGDFRFINQDDVDHVITGADGNVWITAKAHRESPSVGITKVGSWPFSVSDCANRGTVVVE
jgi:plastocyanin